MDLFSLAGILSPLAPVAASIVGGLVGGPAGAAAAGGLTKIIMGKFGLPAAATPAQLSERIAEAGEETARARINAAMEQARAEIVGFAEIEKAVQESIRAGLLQTGQTMRMELVPENRHWFFTGWRPAIGWTFVLFAISFGSMLTLAAAGAALSDNARPLQILTDAWPIFLAYFGTLGLMVGVYIPSRSVDKAKFVDTSTVPAKPAPPAPAPKPAPKPVLPIREPRT